MRTFVLSNNNGNMEQQQGDENLEKPKRRRRRNLEEINQALSKAITEIICEQVKKLVPGFTMDYNVDPVKESIARSWPNSLDDTCAREEWGWAPKWDLASMSVDMLEKIREKKAKGLL